MNCWLSSPCPISQNRNRTHQWQKYSQKSGYKNWKQIYSKYCDSLWAKIRPIRISRIRRIVIRLLCIRFMIGIWIRMLVGVPTRVESSRRNRNKLTIKLLRSTRERTRNWEYIIRKWFHIWIFCNKIWKIWIKLRKLI